MAHVLGVRGLGVLGFWGLGFRVWGLGYISLKHLHSKGYAVIDFKPPAPKIAIMKDKFLYICVYGPTGSLDNFFNTFLNQPPSRDVQGCLVSL